MSEDAPGYGSKPQRNIDPRCLEKFGSPRYQPPDYNQVKILKSKSGLSGAELAKLVGVEPRTFRKWIAPTEAKNSTNIPYSAWRLLLIELGIVKSEEEELEELKSAVNSGHG